MALNSVVGIVFRATDNASRTVNRISASLSNFRRVGIAFNGLLGETGETMALFGPLVLGVAAAIGVFTAGIFGLKSALDIASFGEEFESEMAKVQLVLRETEEGFRRVEKAAEDAAIKSIFGPQEAAKALREFGQSGIDAETSIRALDSALLLAASSFDQLSPERAAGIAVQGLKIFRLEADQTTELIDKLVKVTTTSRLQFSELDTILGRVGAGVVTFGASLDDTIVSLGLVRDQMKSARRAGTGLRRAMTRLIETKVIQDLDSYGVKVKDEATGRTREFLDIFGDMALAFRKFDEVDSATKLFQLFGQDAVGPAKILITELNERSLQFEREGLGAFESMRKAIEGLRGELNDSEGVAQQFMDRLLETFSGMIKFLEGSVEILKTSVAKPFIEIFKPLIKFIKIFVDSLVFTLRAIPDDIKTIIAGLFVLSSAALAFGTIIMAVVLTPIGIAASVVAAGLLALSPILLGVVATFAALSRVIMRDVEFLGNFRKTIDNIKLGVESLFTLIAEGEIRGSLAERLEKEAGVFDAVQLLFGIFATVRNLFSDFITGVMFGLTPFVSFLEQTFENIGIMFDQLWQVAIKPFLKLFGLLPEQLSDDVNKFAVVLGGIVGGIISAFTFLVFFISKIILIVTTVFELALLPIINTITNIIEAFMTGLQTIKLLFTGTWKEVLDEFAKISTIMVRTFLDIVVRPITNLIKRIFNFFGAQTPQFVKDFEEFRAGITIIKGTETSQASKIKPKQPVQPVPVSEGLIEQDGQVEIPISNVRELKFDTKSIENATSAGVQKGIKKSGIGNMRTRVDVDGNNIFTVTQNREEELKLLSGEKVKHTLSRDK